MHEARQRCGDADTSRHVVWQSRASGSGGHQLNGQCDENQRKHDREDAEQARGGVVDRIPGLAGNLEPRSAITIAAATTTKAAASRFTCASVAFHARRAPTPARPTAEKKRARKPGCVGSGWGVWADREEPPFARGRAGALPDEERGDDCAMIIPPYRPPRPDSARRAA